MTVKKNATVKPEIDTDAAAMVAVFHTMAGQPVNTTLTVPDVKAIRFRNHFAIEELIEGVEAMTRADSVCAQRIIELLKQAQAKINELQPEDIDVDFDELTDSLNDQLYVVHGTAHYFGIPMNTTFIETHEKNMTRFPATKAELELTLEKAEKEGVEVFVLFNEDYQRWAVIRKDNGKQYKSACHVKPDYSALLPKGE